MSDKTNPDDAPDPQLVNALERFYRRPNKGDDGLNEWKPVFDPIRSRLGDRFPGQYKEADKKVRDQEGRAES